MSYDPGAPIKKNGAEAPKNRKDTDEISINGNGHAVENNACVQCGEDDGKTRSRLIGGQEVPLHDQCVRFYRDNEKWKGRDPGASDLDIPGPFLTPRNGTAALS